MTSSIKKMSKAMHGVSRKYQGRIKVFTLTYIDGLYAFKGEPEIWAPNLPSAGLFVVVRGVAIFGAIVDSHLAATLPLNANGKLLQRSCSPTNRIPSLCAVTHNTLANAASMITIGVYFAQYLTLSSQSRAIDQSTDSDH